MRGACSLVPKHIDRSEVDDSLDSSVTSQSVDNSADNSVVVGRQVGTTVRIRVRRVVKHKHETRIPKPEARNAPAGRVDGADTGAAQQADVRRVP